MVKPAVLSVHLRMRRAALIEREQGRASSYAQKARRNEANSDTASVQAERSATRTKASASPDPSYGTLPVEYDELCDDRLVTSGFVASMTIGRRP